MAACCDRGTDYTWRFQQTVKLSGFGGGVDYTWDVFFPAHAVEIYGGDMAPHILNLGTRSGDLSASSLGRFTSEETSFGIHWIGDQIGSKFGLDVSEKRQIFCYCLELNHDTWIVLSIAQSVYRQRFSGSALSSYCIVPSYMTEYIWVR